MKTFKFGIVPYRQKLTLHRCSQDELAKWVGAMHPDSKVLEGWSQNSDAMTLIVGGTHVLWFSDQRIAAKCLRANIVHEVCHLVAGVFELAGMKLSRDNEEAFAYLQDHLYTEVATRLGVA